MRSRIDTIPTTLPLVDDGQVPEATVDHQRGRVVGGVARLDRVRMPRHPLGDGSAPVLAGRDRLHDVALGEDRGDRLAVENDDRTDAPRSAIAAAASPSVASAETVRRLRVM